MTRFNDTTYSNTQNNSIRKHNKHTLNNVCVWDRDSHAYTKKYIKYLGYKPANINKSWEQNTQNTQNHHSLLVIIRGAYGAH